MTLFKLFAHTLFSLVTLFLTRKSFVGFPVWRKWLSRIILAEYLGFLVWALCGSDDRLYLFFNNFWVGLVTFISIDLLLVVGLLLFYRKKWKSYVQWAYAEAAILTIVFAGIGHGNTTDPALSTYEVQMPETSGRDSLKILFVTDLHIGRIIGAKEIDHLREMAVKANPDYLIFGGDMIHREISYAQTPEALRAMSRLVKEAVPEGHTFFILGNHEYYADTAEKIDWIDQFGRLIKDETLLLNEGIYLIGRDSFHEEGKRMSLRSLLSKVPSQAPAIVLAHEPEERGEETVTDRPFLALHGHTHAGQHLLFMPFVYLGYPHIYGRYLNGRSTHIISSGYGVSASTIRLGSVSEAVLIKLRY